MALEYDYALKSCSVEGFAAATERERRMLLVECERLACHPFRSSDLVIVDDAGRENRVLDLGGFVLTYWVDHGERMVRILLIEPI